MNLDLIQSYDRDFSIKEFLDGSKKAFKLIVKAFQDRNIEKIKNLLSEEVYENFEDEISYRKTKPVTKLKILSIQAELLDINIINKEAFIKVGFMSKQSATDDKLKSKNNETKKVREVKEVWGFKKKMDDPNPNWILAEVSSY